MKGDRLNGSLKLFLNHLDAIKDTLPMVMLLIEPYRKKAMKEFEDFFDKNVHEIENEDGEKTVAVKYDEIKIYERVTKNSQTSALSIKIIPESLFVSMISQFDAFVNRLLRIMFDIRPEYLNKSERELTYSQLVEFSDIQAAREYILEKEIETILRKSHSDHFDYLEKKLGIPLRTNLPIWSSFIELTERRNLFVHCDGVVSSQYIKVCTENKCLNEKIKLNQRLRITPEYFENVYKTLYELATKLTHTIWRKLLKDDLESADKELNNHCVDLMSNHQYSLSDILLDFACKQKSHFNDLYKNMLVVNKSLSKYLNGEKEQALEIINSKDWSASSDNFKLAHLVLQEKFEDVYNMMEKIGKSGEVEKENYKTWPLFTELRKRDDFKNKFKQIFEEDYSILEVPKKPIQNLINDLIEKKAKNKLKTKDKISSKKLSSIPENSKNEEE